MFAAKLVAWYRDTNTISSRRTDVWITTSQTLTNWTHQNIVMNSKSHRASTFPRQNKGKPDLSKAKVCFADNLETVHEVPKKYSISSKERFRVELPETEGHRYTPLVFRDPYAKPSKRKKSATFTKMFVSDTVKFPCIKIKTTDNNAKQITSKTSKERMESHSEPHLSKASVRASDKFKVGSTLHFKYSDFILRKMDRSATYTNKMFIVK